MKILIIINCAIAYSNLILALEIISTAITRIKRDYPNAKFIEQTPMIKFIGWLGVIVRVLIPIYNIITLVGFLFMRETMIEQSYKTLLDRKIED